MGKMQIEYCGLVSEVPVIWKQTQMGNGLGSSWSVGIEIYLIYNFLTLA